MTRPYDFDNPPTIGEIVNDDWGMYEVTAWKFTRGGSIKALVGNKWISTKKLYNNYVNENDEPVGTEV